MLHWLSFCDDKKPKGKQFLGVVIIESGDFLCAVQEAHLLKINPGGQVQGVEIPERFNEHIPASYLNRLLTKTECEELDSIMEKMTE